MNLLSKLLEKRGIDKVEDLSIEEKAVFDRYKVVLTGETVTIETLKEFCKSQIAVIEARFASPGGVYADDVYFKACLHVYLNLLKAIESPQAERESLEKYLTQLINQP